MRTLSILWAEAVKSHQHNFHNLLVYFSLLIWPALLFVVSYYSFKPFNLSETSPLSQYMDVDQIMLFLLTGYLGYIFFWSLVQSAWNMSYERQAGTLELIFLTPVSRITIMYARAAGNLLEAVWLFTGFTLLVLFATGQAGQIHWLNVPVALLLLSVSAIVWGGFLNIVFLFSRDAGILFTIFEEPMQFFSGVRIPVLAFPLWGKAVAFFFPLTYVLEIFRELVINGAGLWQLASQLLTLAAVLATLFMASFFLIKKAEHHAKETGNMVLF
ncbi:ABC transporter permease [Bacillus sp. T33-2]|uniref:ABC transporter permease n=1 Tax=Bacillus sp. T33-2 TaxID=2054168 RepID=UPI000C760BAF|nr:ABC transporter permease [Bacillus sp. T33-2]PLR92549.1 multidrug ABC transporter permease [Bacillus sp. T33-2]